MTSDQTRPAPADEPAVAVFAPLLMLFVDIHQSSDDGTEIHLHAGGQGYWIARMVQALGVEVTPCAPVGGEPGLALRAIIDAEGMAARLIDSATANAVVIEDHRTDGPPLAATRFPPLGRHEIDELYSATVGASLRAGVCVLAGAHLAPVLSDDHFRRLVADLRKNDVVVVADVSGSPLRSALKSGVDVVKLNHEELVRDGWAAGDSVHAIADAIGRLRRAGAASVVVSRSHRSTIAGHVGGLVEVRSPNFEVLEGRGGGDSMTAALAAAAARGLPFEDGLRLAAAAGSLNVSRHGLGSGRRDSIEELAGHVVVRPARRRLAASSAGRSELEAMSRTVLYEMARSRGVKGRSSMTKAELVAALAGDP